MTKNDIRLAKKKILMCLTQDFDYGLNKRTGKPLKKRKLNQAIFNEKCGTQIYSRTDLSMVMEKVVLGLYFSLEKV